jgi:SPOR domain
MGAVALALSALLLVGCSHEGADWKTASTADTGDAYQKFLTQYPKSPNAPQAQARIKQLQDQHDWQVATAADSRDAYEQYLAQHPDSQNAQEARIRLENFAQSSAATAATATASAGAAVAGQPGLKSAHKATAAAATKSAGAHYVQLGAFSSQARAESSWKRLSSKYAHELGSLTPHYVAGKSHAGSVVRLQVTVSSRSQGKALCDKLRAQRQVCVPVGSG